MHRAHSKRPVAHVIHSCALDSDGLERFIGFGVGGEPASAGLVLAGKEAWWVRPEPVGVGSSSRLSTHIFVLGSLFHLSLAPFSSFSCSCSLLDHCSGL